MQPHDINLALQLAGDYGQSLVERFRNPEPKEEPLVALRVWRRWEQNVSQHLARADQETFLSFGSSTIFPVMGLHLEIANVIEKQVTYLREVILIDTQNSV